MNKIKQLDEQTANLIAAGEVVERPSGVVKELVENAIDAHASRIKILLQEGGLNSITVIDNGEGMSKEDAQNCFLRHATSKIHNSSDLWDIHTLGFRGEALPSIASVSEVTLITSDGKDMTKVCMAYGDKVSDEDYPCDQGTSIQVKGLFYHTPARLKHMRSASYEGSLISQVVYQFALSHPEIAFILENEDRELFRSSGQDNLLEVIYLVYGGEEAKQAVHTTFSDFDYQVEGYLIKPHMNRSTRKMMNIFLNGRIVHSYKLYEAVIQGYDQFLEHGRYPLCVLNIQMDPHLLDVNVHPSKWEVRISKENQLENLLTTGVSDTLKKALIVPSKPIETKPVKTEYHVPLSFEFNTPEVKGETIYQSIHEEAKEDEQIWQRIYDQPVRKEETKAFPAMEVIGLYKNEWILASSTIGIAVINPVSSMYRINYEHLLKERDHTLAEQPLLTPLPVPVNSSIVDGIDEFNDWCKPVSLVFDVIGPETIALRNIPVIYNDFDLDKMVKDLLDLYEERTKAEIAQYETILKRIAREGKPKIATLAQQKELVQQLAQCENSWTDPSGKPTFIFIDEKDIKKELRL